MTSPPSESDFDEFYKSDHRDLCVYLRMRGASWDEAENIAQETYIKLLLQFGAVDSPRAWTRTAAGRMLISDQRRSAKRAGALNGAAETLSNCTQPIFDGGAERVVKLLAMLPSRQREIMALTVDGFKPREIAALLGIEANSVSASLRKARQRLSGLMSESDLGGER